MADGRAGGPRTAPAAAPPSVSAVCPARDGVTVRPGFPKAQGTAILFGWFRAQGERSSILQGITNKGTVPALGGPSHPVAISRWWCTAQHCANGERPSAGENDQGGHIDAPRGTGLPACLCSREPQDPPRLQTGCVVDSGDPCCPLPLPPLQQEEHTREATGGRSMRGHWRRDASVGQWRYCCHIRLQCSGQIFGPHERDRIEQQLFGL